MVTTLAPFTVGSCSNCLRPPVHSSTDPSARPITKDCSNGIEAVTSLWALSGPAAVAGASAGDVAPDIGAASMPSGWMLSNAYSPYCS